jgi:hypothetical protein
MTPPDSNSTAPGIRRSALSPPRRWLLDTICRLGFGRIEQLFIRNGEPALENPPRVIQTITFGGFSQDEQEPPTGDFELKRPIIDLFAHFDRINTGVIERIDIKAGLPCFMSIERPLYLDGIAKSTANPIRGLGQ